MNELRPAPHRSPASASLCLLFLLITSIRLSPATAQTPCIVAEVEEVDIQSSGKRKDRDPLTIEREGATFLSLRFSDLALDDGERLVISGGDGGTRYELAGPPPSAAGDPFWVRHVDGDAVTVEVRGDKHGRRPHEAPPGGGGPDRGGGGGIRYRIDRIAVGTENPGGSCGVEAICGSDDTVWAKCRSGAKYDRSRAVCRLLVAGTHACTGWLVWSHSGRSLVVTNNHCIDSQYEAQNTNYEFMAEGETCDTNCDGWGGCPGTVVATSGELIYANAGLDVSIIELPHDTIAAAIYGALELQPDENALVVGAEIYIPQHPMAGGKKIADMHEMNPCTIDTTEAAACLGGPLQIGYMCDTRGGTSGSPVLLADTHMVVGLHNCANCPNRGEPIHMICSDIQGMDADLHQDICTRVPSSAPSAVPTGAPSFVPSAGPTAAPSSAPSIVPTAAPSSVPSAVPTAAPSSVPSAVPTAAPSSVPSVVPSASPSFVPSVVPTAAPSSVPSAVPSAAPSSVPSAVPTAAPSSVPSVVPTSAPSSVPSAMPTSAELSLEHPCVSLLQRKNNHAKCEDLSYFQHAVCPMSGAMDADKIKFRVYQWWNSIADGMCLDGSSDEYSFFTFYKKRGSSDDECKRSDKECNEKQSFKDAVCVSGNTEVEVLVHPHLNDVPDDQCDDSLFSAINRTSAPGYCYFKYSINCSCSEELMCDQYEPTNEDAWSFVPAPTNAPTGQSEHPSKMPSASPAPSLYPSSGPSSAPTSQPSGTPSLHPSTYPSFPPSSQLSGTPSLRPSTYPSFAPTSRPSNAPSLRPSQEPSDAPSSRPSNAPSLHPSQEPSAAPSSLPSGTPSLWPSSIPSYVPSAEPSTSPRPSDTLPEGPVTLLSSVITAENCDNLSYFPHYVPGVCPRGTDDVKIKFRVKNVWNVTYDPNADDSVTCLNSDDDYYFFVRYNQTGSSGDFCKLEHKLCDSHKDFDRSVCVGGYTYVELFIYPFYETEPNDSVDDNKCPTVNETNYCYFHYKIDCNAEEIC